MHYLFGVLSLLLCFSASAAPQALQVGAFASRAILNVNPDGKLRPLVILLPGSGANGPEEAMPPSYTADGKDHSLFEEFSTALQAGGWNTLQLGKPGVEFHSGWDMQKWFYDKDLYLNLHWQDLLTNVRNAGDYGSSLPGVDPNRIYLLGHSEGTALAVDYAAQDARVKKIVLLGYIGGTLADTIDWQLFRRELELFVATEVDENHDGFVTREEAARHPKFQWKWADGQTQVSYAEIEAARRADPEIVAQMKKYEGAPIWQGILHRAPQYDAAASLAQDIYAFNGTLDTQTRPAEILALRAACLRAKKANCETTLVPGVGHGFSAPLGNPVVDATLGPVEAAFQTQLTELARRLDP